MNLIEQSLASDAREDKLIVMQGPLSEILYRALNKVFDKKGEESDQNLSLETLAQDEAILEGSRQQSPDEPNNGSPEYVVFGIDKLQVEPENIVEVKNIINNKKSNQDVVLFLDSDSHASKDTEQMSAHSNLNGAYSEMSQALEAYCKERHVPIFYHSDALFKFLF